MGTLGPGPAPCLAPCPPYCPQKPRTRLKNPKLWEKVVMKNQGRSSHPISLSPAQKFEGRGWGLCSWPGWKVREEDIADFSVWQTVGLGVGDRIWKRA